MSGRKKVGLAFLLSLALLFLFFYTYFVFMRTPEYIHRYLTPRYEEEAAHFFEENTGTLMELARLGEDVGAGSRYTYTFHVHVFDTPGIPEELRDLLAALEQSTEREYTVTVSPGAVEVHVESDTNFDVYLYYGVQRWHSVMPEWDKATPLEGGWELHAPYVIRS